MFFVWFGMCMKHTLYNVGVHVHIPINSHVLFHVVPFTFHIFFSKHNQGDINYSKFNKKLWDIIVYNNK